jgi:hypothetical protein
MIKKIFSTLLFAFSLPLGAAPAFSKFRARPRLVVLFVVDQFRADFLTRLAHRYKPPGREADPGGFLFLAEKSAYFPTAEYRVMSAVTCPGHAVIATGAYPAFTGIPLNDWYDRKQKKVVGCVEDAKDEVSPARLKTSTVGDELKIVSPQSRVVSISVKDRAAVMLGGHLGDFVLWMGPQGWETSSYYEKGFPAWAQSEKARFEKKISDSKGQLEAKSLQALPVAVELTGDLALKALEGEKLGEDSAPDLLAISFSSHDLAGHRYGPFSPEVEAVSVQIDREISRVLKAVSSRLGSLKDVVVILTGDHGIPPNPEPGRSSKLKQGQIDSLEFFQKVGGRLNSQFGRPPSEWLKASLTSNYYLNEDALNGTKASRGAVEAIVKEEALKIEGVAQVFTRTDYERGLNLHPHVQEQVLNQYTPETGGDIVVLPEAFFRGKDDKRVNHVTGYAYDRFVPLFIYGRLIKSGVYPHSIQMIDLAPTLSFILGQLPPAKSQGSPLKEIF